MMTSAPTPACPPAGYPSPSPSPSPAAGADADEDMAPVALRLVNVKRPLGPTTVSTASTDSCKKRRKQATPIRISNTGINQDMNLDIGLCYEGKLPLFPSLHSPDPDQDPEPELEPEPEPEPDSESIKVEQSHSPVPVAISLPTPIPTSISPSLPVNLSGGQNFPSWLSDMQSKSNNDWLSTSVSTTSATSTLPNHNFYVPVPVSRAPTSQPPIRIFNPEAYCELCNKEFCNKYFLKTHKANKHRIYTDPPCSDAVSLPPVTVPSFTSMKKPPISLSDKSATTLNNTDYMGIFCDLCGKSFPNKMVLKTHRISVHGTVDPECSNTEIESLSLSLAVDPVHKEERDHDSELIDIVPAPVSTPMSTPVIISTSAHTTTTISLMDKDAILYKNEHLKEEPTNTHLPSMDQDENSENTIILNSQQRERENIDFANNRARRLGIMNPEAFCEICCKEYCNKYFLRTHKMKRHGILIPDDNSKDNQKDFKLELSISNNWYQIQTSPLNLIMGEQNTNSSGSCSERKSSPANENECEICGMRFQTVYLAQLHFATAHSQSQTQLQSKLVNTNITNDDFAVSISANNNDKQAPDSISEDLQKLQTMILQLNDLDVSKVAISNSGSTICTCSMCGKEFDNRYYLHAHLMTEHGVLLENQSYGTDKQYETDNGQTPSDVTSEVQSIDNQVQPKVSNVSASISDKKDDSNGFPNSDKLTRISNMNTNSNTNGNSIGSERRSSVTMTPANSYCEICNKELCNKYFMKTHMQRMHGIEIENGAQIGGVVCNICNKELCSKYFLRVHKHNTHGIVQDNVGGSSNSQQVRQSNVDIEQQQGIATNTTSGQIPIPVSVQASISTPSSVSTTDISTTSDPSLKLGDLSDLSNRYFTHFTEVCTICSRRFRSTKWLKAHLLGDHGKAGTEKWTELELQLQQSFNQQQTQQRKNTTSPTLRIPNGGQDSQKTEGGMQNVLSSIFGTDESNVKQYHCSFCTFSTPVLAFLFVHERSHNQAQTSNSIVTPASSVSPLYCAMCNQSFRQPEHLHHHIVSQHAFLSLSSFFGNGNVHQPNTETKHEHESVQDQQIDHACTKCSTCGRGSKLDFNTDVSITLKDVSKQRQLPATYALPQPHHQLKAKYIMQAFLMDEPTPRDLLSHNDAVLNAGGTGTLTGTFTVKEANGNGNGNSSGNNNICDDEQQDTRPNMTKDRRFAPSIVFLPVLEKLTTPLTVSFTLTPA